jgi:DNA transposition AAA+ family ATPase
MKNFASLIPNFAEDTLPPGQEPILTSNVMRFKSFIMLLTNSNNGYSTMGVVTGVAGVGKTVAIQTYVDSQKPLLHTGLLPVVKIKVKPGSTPKALATDIVTVLKDKPRGRNTFEMADEAADAIIRNDLKLIIVDEADRLNEDSFEVLRHIFDKTGCPILIVGLPNILSVIDRHEKFASRVGLRMNFGELEVEEILDLVLPNLVFERWEFNPDNPTDRAMGERIWEMVKPSLRKLRNLLQIASQTAKAYETPRITPEIIEQAFNWSASTADKHRLSGTKANGQQVDETGEYERQSEIRNEAKRRKKSKPK